MSGLDWKHVTILGIAAALLAVAMYMAFKFQSTALVMALGAALTLFFATVGALFTAKPGATQTTTVSVTEPKP